MKKYYFFWKGILSNWYKSEFTYNNYKYSCGEQMMMHQKALLFKDFEIANIILGIEHPRDIKEWGRRIRNFDSEVWNQNKKNIVKSGLISRFSQDSKFRDYLLLHKDYTFVEASPYDRIWGIGYAQEDALNNISNWGENLLGEILTEIVNDCMNESR